ncbi:unnamed protein product, partial [Rotaria magnacalcarata]
LALYVIPLHTAADGIGLRRHPPTDWLKLFHWTELGQHEELLARQRHCCPI